MQNFLKGRKLCLYVTVNIPKLTKVTAETDDAFRTCLIDWDSKHHQILTWFRNTIILSIAALLGSFDDAQGVWDIYDCFSLLFYWWFSGVTAYSWSLSPETRIRSNYY